MSKSKSRALALTELNFVSSLPLEESVRLVGGLASPQMPVTLTEVDDDNFQFELVDVDASGKGVRAKVEGTLRRWEGTYTRLDCTGDVYREAGEVKEPTFQTLVILCIGVMAATFVLQISTATGILLLFGAVITLGYLISTRSSDAQSEIPDKVYFRERDALLNRLINAFTTAGDVSLDGTQLDGSDDVGAEAALDELEYSLHTKSKR